MIIKNVNLETVCGITSAIPDNLLDEVAFAGKSNVGKSSLINALMNRKSLARTSSQPGKTQTINFYNVNEAMYLVDLPGYGYAKVSKEERDRWGRLMESYFQEPGLISLGVLIVDARHKPTADDVTMFQWFRGTGCPVVVVANKLDKLKKSEIEPNLQLIRDTLELEEQDCLVPFSAPSGWACESGPPQFCHLLPKTNLWLMVFYLSPLYNGCTVDSFYQGGTNHAKIQHFLASVHPGAVPGRLRKSRDD